MEQDVRNLYSKIALSIDECIRTEERCAKAAEYTDAIKLQGMVDAYKKVKWDLKKILENK